MELQSYNEKMSSREIAHLTGKRHDNVLRDISKLNLSYEKLGFLKIEEGYYRLPKTGNQEHKEMFLTKIQTMDLMTGYNTELRIKVNRRWEELENAKKIDPNLITKSDLARMILESEEENKQLKIANAKLQNRSDVYDKVFSSEKYLSGSQVCKILELGYGNKTLYKKLREIGIFFKSRNEPMQHFATKKYIMLKEKWIEGKNEPVLTPFFAQNFIPHLAMKLGAVVNNLQKIQTTK